MCAAAATLLTAGGAGQGEQSIYVTVEDHGRLVSGLESKDFELLEDDRPRPFRLEPAERPASIAVLVENAQDSRALFAREIRWALRGFGEAASGDHWYALASFAHTLSIDVDFTRQRARIASGYDSLAEPLWNDIDLWDAMYEMLDRLARLPGRRILLVVASGADTLSAHSRADVRGLLDRTTIVVFACGLGAELRNRWEPYWSPAQQLAATERETALRSLASASGGASWFPAFETAFADVGREIAERIDHQYRLVYVPDVRPDGRFHEVKVRAYRTDASGRRSRLTVSAKSGWRWPRTT